MADTSPATLITGASGGIGEALVYEFAKERGTLVLVARGGDALARVAMQAKERGAARVETVTLDLAQPQAADDLEQTLTALGLHVDTLVNNAGYGLQGRFDRLDEADEIGIIDLNIRAVTVLCRRFLPGMVARRHGGILNIASTAAFAPGPLMAVYYASKAYILSFSRAISAEVRKHGVTVTTFCPGITATGFQTRARAGDLRMMRMIPVMTAPDAAAAGYRAYRARKPFAIAGAVNRVMVASSRLAPSGLVTAMTHYLNGRNV
jgi:uncharacterized protein